LFTPTGAGTRTTGIVDHPSRATACRTGALNREKPLLGTDLARPLTRRTVHGVGATGRAGSLTLITGCRGVDLDPGLLAGEGILKTDIQIVTQVRAARSRPTTTLAATAAHELTEHLVKDIRKAPTIVEPAAAGMPAAAVLEGFMAIAIIRGALLLILQDVVSLIDFLERCSAFASPGFRSGCNSFARRR
jgi:hypothetical protein